jgi:hypothetical protein
MGCPSQGNQAMMAEFDGLVTLHDVLRFAAQHFWKASEVLTELRENPALAKGTKAGEMVLALTGLMNNLRALDLPVSVREIEKFNLWMNPFMQGLVGMTSLEKQKETMQGAAPIIRTKIEQLSSVIQSELESRAFFHVQQTFAAYYDQPELFGVEVISRFASIQYDMVEAGNCYALGRSTACVFHLMRIMEIGVQQFGDSLGVSVTSEKNWQNILDEVNKAIKKLPHKDKATIEMSQLSANLYSVKLAWRNEVMHPKDTYTLEEASDLIRHVKMFMTHLARVL